MRVYYSDQHPVPLPSAHRFPMEKYRRVREQFLLTRVLVPSQHVGTYRTAVRIAGDPVRAAR